MAGSKIVIVHIRQHMRKLSDKHGDWGFSAKCDPKFLMQRHEGTNSENYSNCPGCIAIKIIEMTTRLDKAKERLRELT